MVPFHVSKLSTFAERYYTVTENVANQKGSADDQKLVNSRNRRSFYEDLLEDWQ
jgi:hypothetical protein